ncbi:hypothetical protein ACJX0J_025788, partial [Zea mays]
SNTMNNQPNDRREAEIMLISKSTFIQSFIQSNGKQHVESHPHEEEASGHGDIPANPYNIIHVFRRFLDSSNMLIITITDSAACQDHVLMTYITPFVIMSSMKMTIESHPYCQASAVQEVIPWYYKIILLAFHPRIIGEQFSFMWALDAGNMVSWMDIMEFETLKKHICEWMGGVNALVYDMFHFFSTAFECLS